MGTEISLIVSLLDQAFDHKAWHGTNLKGALRGHDGGRGGLAPG